jgi:dihydrofolate reductase
MGKLVVSEFVTMDGVFQDPGGTGEFEHGGWSFKFDRSAEGDEFKLNEVRAADVLLLGRVTYEGFAAAWPQMEETAGEFGVKFNSMPKYVVSGTLKDPEWRNSTVLAPEGAIDAIRGLTDQYEGDILVNGSGQLARALFEAGLVDECRLMVFPIALGTGKRLFDGLAQPITMELAETRAAGESSILVYTRK